MFVLFIPFFNYYQGKNPFSFSVDTTNFLYSRDISRRPSIFYLFVGRDVRSAVGKNQDK